MKIIKKHPNKLITTLLICLFTITLNGCSFDDVISSLEDLETTLEDLQESLEDIDGTIDDITEDVFGEFDDLDDLDDTEDVPSGSESTRPVSTEIGATNTPVPTATPSTEPTATSTTTPTATATSAPTATATVTVAPTSTPIPTATNTPVPTATSTPVPTATNTPIPTATSTPVPTATNTPTPTATNTPVPTATNTATPTPTSTNTPTPTATDRPSAEIGYYSGGTATESAAAFYDSLKKSSYPIDYRNSDIPLVSSRDEVPGVFIERCTKYLMFNIMYADASCFMSPDEIKRALPEVCDISVGTDYSGVYANGILVTYTVSHITDPQYNYAIRTGDYSVLTDNEKYAVNEIKKYSDQWGLKNMSDFDKILYVHDKLVEMTEYDTAINDVSHTAYGWAKNHIAVCDGYSDTFRIFMLLNNIPCLTVSGYAGGDHAWNQVCLSGNWYNLDVTWDDPVKSGSSSGDRKIYTYFLKSDEKMSKDHTVESEYAVTCSSTDYDMYYYDRFICSDMSEVYERINTQVSENEDTITIVYIKGTLDPEIIVDAVIDVVNSGVTYYPEKDIGSGFAAVEVVNPLK